MTKERTKLLLKNACEYISECVGNDDAWVVLTDVIGFTDSEIDQLFEIGRDEGDLED